MKVLVDTNIVLDVFLKREPFYKDSLVIFQLACGGSISGNLAAVSMTNTFFLLRKALKDCVEIYRLMGELTALFTVAPVTETTISGALALRWKDFEDAVQFITAKENDVKFIVTRNKTDFITSDIPCMTPAEFIRFLKEKESDIIT